MATKSEKKPAEKVAKAEKPAKTTAKTATAGKTVEKAPKKIAPPAGDKKPNALQKPLTPSKELAEVVGPAQLARGEAVSKIWEYIRSNNLQNPANRREILADAKLKPVFSGLDKVTMFEMNKHLAKHLS